MGSTLGEMQFAKRRARNLFDDWNDVTGQIAKFSGYYYEIMDIIDDAAECGVQMGVGVYEKLDSESH